jgi:predicted acyltransferase
MRYAEVPLALQGARAGAAGGRVISLDALRGFNFIWILGGDGAVWALAYMLHDKGAVARAISHVLGTQMTHAVWDGFHFYDLIFPLFIFITGVAIVLSLPKLTERKGPLGAHWHVLRRTLLLYVLGLVYYGGLTESWQEMRFLGVLQRIAICYCVASLLVMHVNWRGLAVAFVALLGGYWALMTFVPVPGWDAPNLVPEFNLAAYVDARYLPGHLFDTTTDPEGLLSTLPAIASCLIGVFAGLLLKNERVMPQAKVLWLIGAGVVMLAAGYLWSLQFPIIKYIWTSSFVLVAGGFSAILLGVFYQVIDVWGFQRWATPLVWIGANAIMLYFINGVTGFEPFARRFVGGDVSRFFDALVTPGMGALVSHLVGLGFVLALAGYFYRRKIFLKV